jgi:hypothetical protein
MSRYFTRTFVRFFVGFVVILGVAFGVLSVTSALNTPVSVDNLAAPR